MDDMPEDVMMARVREAHLRAFLAGETLITPLELRAVVRAAIKARDEICVVLRGALEWYADEDVWRVPMQAEMANADDLPTSDAQADAGEKARAAIVAAAIKP
jgi:hypothetical protein